MTHKEIENELGCWGDIIRENPDRYANDLYYYNGNHAIDETCVFYEFYEVLI